MAFIAISATAYLAGCDDPPPIYRLTCHLPDRVVLYDRIQSDVHITRRLPGVLRFRIWSTGVTTVWDNAGTDIRYTQTPCVAERLP